MSITLDLSKVDREKALSTWLAYHGIQRKILAKQLGVTPGAITRIIQGKNKPKKRIKHLIELGIPADLLPKS